MPTKIMDQSTTLFARVEAAQYEALRLFAFKDRVSIAHVVRQALDMYIESRVDEMPHA